MFIERDLPHAVCSNYLDTILRRRFAATSPKHHIGIEENNLPT
jgi:hypothetical protein